MTSPFVSGPDLRIAGAPGGPLTGLTLAAKTVTDEVSLGILGENPSGCRSSAGGRDGALIAVAKAMEAVG